MNLDSTSSTQSPSDSFKLPTAIATRIPPELLLDIFSIVSDSPQTNYKEYIERNRNLKSCALVNSRWRYLAQEVLQEEVYIDVQIWMTQEQLMKDLTRKIQPFADAEIRGTKYLKIYGHLDELIAISGIGMWAQVKYLSVWASSTRDMALSMSELDCFPQLEELIFHEPIREPAIREPGYLKILPSDSRLQFPMLRRIISDGELEIVASLNGDGTRTKTNFETARSVFSTANMPNLLHLAFYIPLFPQRYTFIANILSCFTTLSLLADGEDDIRLLLSTLHAFDKLQHLSLYTDYAIVPYLFDAGKLSLESFHLERRMLEEEQELLPRLIRIAKGRDPMVRIERIVIYGSLREIETRYEKLTHGLEAIEWREGQQSAPFKDFDGR